LRAGAIDDGGNDGIAVNAEAGEVGRATMVPIRVIVTFVLDLLASSTSILFSERAVRLLERSLLIMEVFHWGRNRERLKEFASLLSKVTPSVARFPCKRWRAVALLINTMEIKRNLIFIKSSSFAVVQVFLIRSEKPVAQAGRAESKTTFILWAGLG
jgi:hypothetical protein